MVEITIVVICLFFNALLALVEMAFVSVSKSEIKSLSKNNSLALKLLRLRERPERTLSVLQIGITVVGSISAAVGGIGAEDKISPYFSEYGFSETISKTIAVILVVVPLTYFNTVIGELVPKTLALRFPMKIALRSVLGLAMAEKVLSPFVEILEKSTQVCLKLFAPIGKNQSQSSETSESLNISNLSNAHQQYVINLVHIETKRIKDIMLPWDKVNYISSQFNLNEVLSMVIKSGHTRLPVISEDEVVGILHSKEFITFISSGDENWKNIIRPVLKIGPNEGILRTLRLMQEKKSHMALVLMGDERIGIVTLEDIFEEIIGDIYDEDDDGMLRKVLSQRMLKIKQ
ncbi:MAG: hemolysin family protein [Bdellovibrionaceae bacterium]|nr:hemolysin family protein [Bacteriovoracaceae bacterium]MCK6598204.1 hemolysin family protein [Pseudobdellovibrionaceae bacterium]NUM58424.1 HlyC/CorC family transporter [Pseudobdellovibrionaceae bacterium]